jgi:alpha-tubulin suppressor-like RCC1 family protein
MSIRDIIQAAAGVGGAPPPPPFTGILYAWGDNFDGQIGNDSVADVSSPVQIGSAGQWPVISFGSGFTAGIDNNGDLYMWGTNSFGELGLNDVVNRSSPVQVGSATYSTVMCGSNTTAAIRTDGTLWAWGYNAQGGVVGDNTIINRSSPVQIGALSDWAQLAAMTNGFLAIKTNGTLWAWGQNGNGNLGDNTTIDRSSPVQIGALSDWAQVDGGNLMCGAIKTNGTLWTWGTGASGTTGHNDIINRSSPTQVGALSNWALVAAGGANFCGAIKTDGTLWMWGSGSLGRTGLDTTLSVSSPTQVGALSGWTILRLGLSNGLALRVVSGKSGPEGTLFSWGSNFFGQQGQIDTVSRSSPAQIGSLTTWTGMPLEMRGFTAGAFVS